ncbi:hypothetical protein CCACVL1_25687 [Corchorus capsularis]|uniref:Uncharacterized protein n=1 Tax=Corchorus capsularis TaxID=210143 RepID=A0A1R3GI35_COCAP|nr:hypothetical protein CCACVL1_25687 [Corchorus capsularis]
MVRLCFCLAVEKLEKMLALEVRRRVTGQLLNPKDGKEESVKWRALTEEHARDSFENLLFSVCRFRELTGTYPQNITVVSYDFKEERFAHLHRSAIGFPESQFFYVGTPASPTSSEGALKGEALVRTQFQQDPYGCIGSLKRKKVGRDPFHRSIPYPNGCPEIEGLFRYCGIAPYRAIGYEPCPIQGQEIRNARIVPNEELQHNDVEVDNSMM